MANIKRIDGKTGVSFKITVTKGRDTNGKQIRHYMTWAPDKPMSEQQMKKTVERVAVEFEKSIEQGFQLDQKQVFSSYAEYVIDLKEKSGCKYRTIERYRELMTRINDSIGYLRLTDIRPQHLNMFYENLSERGIAASDPKAVATADISSELEKAGISKTKASELTGLSATTIKTICKGDRVSKLSADKISSILNKRTDELFEVEEPKNRLSNKTILEHHRLIHTILAQAEKEMLVPYNAADKATPPKAVRKEVNYFQQEDIANILEALETEPIKWRTITHLLLITGCRRGEIMGLKWSKVDFENNQLKIDTNLLYSSKRGIYEDTTKTASSERYVKIPQETTDLLKEYREWYLDLKQKNGDRWVDSDFCFTKDDGTPMIPDSITAWLNKFSEKHGLPHINPHAFRHTMASILINSGKDIVSVSKRLGHSKTSTTTDIYAHVIKEADEQASESLADVMLRNKT